MSREKGADQIRTGEQTVSAVSVYGTLGVMSPTPPGGEMSDIQTQLDHAREARDLLHMADRARNADNWPGDRNADSAALAAMAQAHATLALTAMLEQIGVTLSWEPAPRSLAGR